MMTNPSPPPLAPPARRGVARLALVIPLAVFLALGAALYFGLGRDPTLVASPLVGAPLPAFILPEVRAAERMFDSSELTGEPVLLNVWASWCAACLVEHPLFLAVAQRGDVPIYGLNYKDKRADAVRWLDRYGDPYQRSAHDPEGTVGFDLGVYGVPETLVIDAEGRIAHKHVGPLTPEDWTRDIEPLLKKLREEAAQ